jgi:hypothetical protein
MTRSLSADDLRAVRLRAQLLAGGPAGSVGAAVLRLCGVQAQSAPAARLTVRARTRGLTAADVDRAGDAERTVVRTWAMRGTLHMVPAADARWLVELLGPVFLRAGRRRRRQLDLDDGVCERGLRSIETVLTGSAPLTRAQLVERIAGEGVRIDPRSQAPAHLIAYAALRGLICRGPGLARDEPTYVLLDAWVGPSPGRDRDDALGELARRYLRGYGPATTADFATWSGLPAAGVRRAFGLLGSDVVEVDVPGGRALARADADLEPPADRPLRLLGPFDGYLLGYRGRDLILDPSHRRRIQAGGGIIRPAVLAGGRVVGGWRLDRRGGRATVVVEPFTALPPDSGDGLRAEADDVGRFLGCRVDLRVRAADG